MQEWNDFLVKVRLELKSEVDECRIIKLQHMVFALQSVSGAIKSTVEIPLPDTLMTAVDTRINYFRAGRICLIEGIGVLLRDCKRIVSPNMDSKGVPIWPQGTIGSISHSGKFGMGIFAKTGSFSGLGIDFEVVDRSQSILELAEFICTEKEIQILNQVYSPEEAVLILFSSKESIYKAINESINYNISFHDATLVKINEKRLKFHLSKLAEKQLKNILEIEVLFYKNKDFVLTLCLVD